MWLLCSLSGRMRPTNAPRLRLQPRRAAGTESRTHAWTRGEAVSGPPSRYAMHGTGRIVRVCRVSEYVAPPLEQGGVEERQQVFEV